MQTLRQLTLFACLLGAGLGFANVAVAAPAAGIIEAAPAVAASATTPDTPFIQKAWYYHRYWYHRCWHCWHHYYWRRHYYWHRPYYWHRRYYWHRYYY